VSFFHDVADSGVNIGEFEPESGIQQAFGYYLLTGCKGVRTLAEYQSQHKDRYPEDGGPVKRSA
jgi:hypothetical protein